MSILMSRFTKAEWMNEWHNYQTCRLNNIHVTIFFSGPKVYLIGMNVKTVRSQTLSILLIIEVWTLHAVWCCSNGPTTELYQAFESDSHLYKPLL